MIAFRNPLFDGQLRRTLGHGTYGGAELGECLAAAAQVTDGDRESWYRAWTALADRISAAAESSAAHGHRESARCAFARASNYYRSAYIFHLEAPLPNLVPDAYGRHRAALRRAVAVMVQRELGWVPCAPRAAAHDRRVAACVLDPAQRQ